MTSTLPPSGSSLTFNAPSVPVQVTFNEAYASASIGIDDLTLSQGSVTGYQLVNATTVKYDISGISNETPLALTIAAGAVTDVYGNPSAAYSATYSVDIVTASFPAPLTAEKPLGSLIYDGSTNGAIGTSSDTDTFTIDLDEGQMLTAVVVPASTLRPTLSVIGPAGLNVGPVTAPAVNKQVVVQALLITTAGTYTVTVGSTNGTTGQYTLQLTLNAVVEEESHDGASNSSFATAQSLDAAFLPLGGAAQAQP